MNDLCISGRNSELYLVHLISNCIDNGILDNNLAPMSLCLGGCFAVFRRHGQPRALGQGEV